MSLEPLKIFLTGTDTGVGKTFVAAALIRGLRGAGIVAAGFKPICCGARDDALALHAATGGSIGLNDINPVWLRTPAAPCTAAIVENRTIDLALIRKTFARLSARHESLVVEGIGGWRVPIARDYFVGDLAREFALPVGVVVANRLGALNHTLLTVESIRAAGLDCAGILLNHPVPHTAPEESVAVATNRALLEELCGVPILAEVAHGQKEITV